MAVNQGDIEFAFFVLNSAIYTHKPLSVQDCALIKAFIEAILEQQSDPTANVKSREWRAAIYQKLLEDPEALQQFTLAALEKFGPEHLAQMVAPQLQELILEGHLGNRDTEDLVRILKEQNRLKDILDYLLDTQESWVKDHFGLQEDIDEAYDRGFAEGRRESQDEYQRGFDEGYEQAKGESE